MLIEQKSKNDAERQAVLSSLSNVCCQMFLPPMSRGEAYATWAAPWSALLGGGANPPSLLSTSAFPEWFLMQAPYPGVLMFSG
jgi:hypothetical protein